MEPRCYICTRQRRPSDLLSSEFLRICLFCGRNYCAPHHSANPHEFTGVTRTAYRYKWVDYSGNSYEAQVAASMLCLICGLTPQPRDFKASEHIAIKERSQN